MLTSRTVNKIKYYFWYNHCSISIKQASGALLTTATKFLLLIFYFIKALSRSYPRQSCRVLSATPRFLFLLTLHFEFDLAGKGNKVKKYILCFTCGYVFLVELG
jgi:hypothetical protein